VNESKVKAIKCWHVPPSITKVRSFHGFALFYHRFIKDFSLIIVPLIVCMNKEIFVWTKTAQKAFEAITEKLCSTPTVDLSKFELMFEVECDADGVGIRSLSQAQAFCNTFISQDLAFING